jgi:RNA polymerase sigma factor (sigma-70 family)
VLKQNQEGGHVATDQDMTIGRHLRSLFENGTIAGLTDGQLLERFATDHGSQAGIAFEAIVERHGPMVLRACRSILRNEHDAHDAFQATFLVLIRKGRSLWVRESLGPWLHRVACRAAIRARRASKRRTVIEQKTAAVPAVEAFQDDHAELVAVVQEEIERLPERYRAPIVLCDLQGHTCETTARLLGCPIGTIGSRLSRGRDRLRSRFLRRGLAPSGAAVGIAIGREAAGESLPLTLVETTVRLAVGIRAGRTAAAASTQVELLARTLSRNMLMSQYKALASAALAIASLLAAAGWIHQISAASQAPQEKTTERSQPKTRPVETRQQTAEFMRARDPADERERHKDFLIATFANLRPLIKTELGVSFQSREVVLYKDGTVKLWLWRAKEPMCPPLRHDGPIREVACLDEAKLLITASDDSVKLWDGLTGSLRKEINGQVVRPLFFNFKSPANRFVTVDVKGTQVTTWDAETLNPIDTFRPQGVPRLIGSGLCGDGTILATIAEDRSVTLWDASRNHAFATLRSPSKMLETVFIDDQAKELHQPVLQLHEHFWNVVQSELAPRVADVKPAK